ncbi:MAG: thiamine phosphate synthase [Acidobacteria bacterium]|nr:thiamine phosphate synthase [Acidobacteriota bacterium]
MLDPACFPNRDALLAAAGQLVSVGAVILQYRNKGDDGGSLLAESRRLREAVFHYRPDGTCRLIMNDRADLCLAADFDGVHVGQLDLLPESARRIIGEKRWLGISTHNFRQAAEAEQSPADYIAIGPVFDTLTKSNPDPVVGLDGVRRARELTSKPLVAIGGITRENCQAVIEAGADAVAVISDLVRQPGKSAEEFLRILG